MKCPQKLDKKLLGALHPLIGHTSGSNSSVFLQELLLDDLGDFVAGFLASKLQCYIQINEYNLQKTSR